MIVSIMTRNYRNYTDQDIIDNAKKVHSLSKLLKSLNLIQAGGNFINMKRNLQRLNIDTSHWKGQGWNKGDQLKDWSDYTSVEFLKKHLLKLRGNKCECCGRTKWLKKIIKLEIEHINGDRTDNKLKNLKLLCPNCHSFTPTWRKQKTSCSPTGSRQAT